MAVACPGSRRYAEAVHHKKWQNYDNRNTFIDFHDEAQVHKHRRARSAPASVGLSRNWCDVLRQEEASQDLGEQGAPALKLEIPQAPCASAVGQPEPLPATPQQQWQQQPCQELCWNMEWTSVPAISDWVPGPLEAQLPNINTHSWGQSWPIHPLGVQMPNIGWEQDWLTCSLEAQRPKRRKARPAPTSQWNVDDLFAKFNAGEGIVDVLIREPGSLQKLWKTQRGSRFLQKALGGAESIALADLLLEQTAKAVTDQFGNYIWRELAELLPHLVAQKLHSTCLEVAKERHGVTVIQTLLKVASADGDVAALVRTLLARFSELAEHAWGHFVLETIIEHGQDDQKILLADCVTANFAELWKPRNVYGRYVVKKAKEFGLVSTTFDVPAKQASG